MAALSDFIQSLQQQDIVYSTPPPPSIRVIPPDKPNIKIIPPEDHQTVSTTPKVIKLKIKQKQVSIDEKDTQPASNFSKLSKPPENWTAEPVEIKNTSQQQSIQRSAQQNTSQQIEQKSVAPVTQQVAAQIEQPIIQQPKELTDEEIFNNTGTELSKKGIWFEYFEKAKHSKKSNPIVDRMKVGRFTITPDNKVLLLPDYDIVGKDPDDVLKDKWF